MDKIKRFWGHMTAKQHKNLHTAISVDKPKLSVTKHELFWDLTKTLPTPPHPTAEQTYNMSTNGTLWVYSYYTWNCPKLCCEGTCSNPAASSGEPWNQPMSDKLFLCHKPKHQKYIQPTGETAWKGSQRKQSVIDPYCLTNQCKSVIAPLLSHKPK